jgi:outer membrane protein assembly factor BamB
VTRATAVFLALSAGLAAGCASAPEEERAAPPPPRVEVKRDPGRKVYVAVVDGDTRQRVRGALVRIGDRSDRVSARGFAALRAYRTGAVVRVEARGYKPKSLRVSFRNRIQTLIRIYRPALQWPMYGVGPARTHAHPSIRLRPPFRIVWSRGIGTLIEFPAVVSDGVAYIGNFRGDVFAVSMRNGKYVWRHDIPQGKMAASPAVVGDELVLHGMDGNVWVLDRGNGRLLWRYRVGAPVEPSPVVDGGVDYFGSSNGNVYALDLRRRKLRWIFRGGYKITSSVALVGGTLFLGDYGGRVLALDAATGRLRWSRTVNGRVYGTPAVAAGRVFVPSSTGNSLTAFTTRGRYLWRVNTGSYVYSSPAVWKGRVVFGSYNGVFYCVSARSGRTLWTVSTGGRISGAAAVIDGIAYAGSSSRRIYGVDIRTGRVLLRFPHGDYVPVSGNGGRLLFHGFSRLYAVEQAR